MTTPDARSKAVRRVAVPKVVPDVDARWLTDALGVEDPGIVVHEARVLQSLGGACTKLRVAIRTNRPGFPATVIVKGCLEPHTQPMSHMMLREVNVYTRIVPELTGVQTIGRFFAQGDTQSGAILIMEDLDVRGARCLHAMEPIEDLALAMRFIDTLARLHSHWWNTPEINEDGRFGWLPDLHNPPFGRATSVLLDPGKTADMLSRPRAAATPQMFHDLVRVHRAFNKMVTYGNKEPVVFAHGDAHLSNLFVDAKNEPGLLDWTSWRGPWIHDVAYFIGGCLDVADRRSWEAALLEHYLAQLATHGITSPPPFDHAWLMYRRWCFWGLCVWLMNTTNFHTEPQITAMTTRYAMAALDHDAYALVGV